MDKSPDGGDAGAVPAGRAHSASWPAEFAAFSWGPDRRLIYLAAAATVGAVVWRVVDTDPENRLVAVVSAVVCAVVAVLLFRIRLRLRAGRAGIVVTGPLRSRRIPWAEVEVISTPRRGRFGRHATWLELEIRAAAGADGAGEGGAPAAAALDAGADDVPELLAFGAFDLGTDPGKVGRTLLRLRAGT